nr:PREDICTED: dendritic cell-specific transmembrane protein [Latimeria chalumnae]|eukprot:XP_006000470.1 PREDICTED: dendritic cell-specific transmembrane protein [Latimeria chalumnae]
MVIIKRTATLFYIIVRFFIYLWKLFISERKPGWKNGLRLLALCCAVGFTSIILFPVLYLSLQYTAVVSLAITVCNAIVISVSLFVSRHIRCFSILFLISCGMQQGRNALITAGTGVVVFCNVKNIFHNLKCLADSIICNLEKRRISLNTTPFDNYIRAIKWLYEQGQIKFGVGDLKLITVESDFNIKASNSTEMLQKKLKSARHQLETIATKVSKLLDTVSYLGHKLLPALGILLILISTALCIRRYLHRKNKKCDNVFITKHFIVFDEHQKQQGKPGLLPLNRSERKQYIIIPSMHLTANEVKRMGLFLLPVITHIIIWTVFIAIDYLLYWLISAISKHLQDLPVLEIPLKLAYNVSTYWDHFVVRY